MASSPDPLFRNGLEHYRKPAPASVWDRIESGLDRKRRKSIWLKVAAGLCLLIAASTVLWQYDQANTVETQESVSSQLSAISYQSSPISPLVPEEESIQSPNSSSIVERTSAERSRSSRKDLGRSSQQSAVGSEQSTVGSQQSAIGSQKSISILDEEQPITSTEPEEIIIEPAPLNSTESTINDVIAEQKGTSITYTAEQVNSKFIKKDLPAQATQEKKNTSGLQKVIDKALDLTNEGTVYGELREKKNEWLSLNILSNKAETNK